MLEGWHKPFGAKEVVSALALALPVDGEQFVEFVVLVGWDSGEDVADVGYWFDVVSFARGYYAEEDGCGLSASVAAYEQPVFSAYGNPAERVLGKVVVDGKVAIGCVDFQSIKLIECICYG